MSRPMLLRLITRLSLALGSSPDFALGRQQKSEVQVGRGRRADVLRFELIENRILECDC